MNTAIAVAFITGGCTSLANIIVCAINNRSAKSKMEAKSDHILYRLEQLEKKQDKHNSLIERMFIVEKNICILDEKEKELEKEINDLK